LSYLIPLFLRYSEVEHARLHWLRQQALSRPSSRPKRVVPRAVAEGRQEPSTVSSIAAKKVIADEEAEKRLIERRPKVVVCDKQKGEFLGTWDRLFVRLLLLLSSQLQNRLAC
jgi:hypothetical protein